MVFILEMYEYLWEFTIEYEFDVDNGVVSELWISFVYHLEWKLDDWIILDYCLTGYLINDVAITISWLDLYSFIMRYLWGLFSNLNYGRFLWIFYKDSDEIFFSFVG